MIIAKFGGTSIVTRQRLHHMARLAASSEEPAILVVSALGDTTEELLAIGGQAEQGSWPGVEARVDGLRRRHEEICDAPDAHEEIARLFGHLGELLRGVSALQEQTPRSLALLSSFGERLSTVVVAAHLRAHGLRARAVDARQFMISDDSYLDATLREDPTRKATVAVLQPLLDQGQLPVVTGFLAATADGVTTTLGRGGSDYTATVLGHLFGAREICIWTDVDGIQTADPRLVTEARTLPQVSYREAAEMSFLGAKVLHSRSIVPAMTADIPIRVRSTLHPQSPGTVVAATSEVLPQGVKTVASIRNLALVTVDGRGMAGLPGFSSRIFDVSNETGVNVVMISQASSEQAVSVVVDGAEAERFTRAMTRRFELELAAGVIEHIDCQRDVAALSIIGRGMAGTPGIAGRLFGALGRVGVNVLSIAQGATELSISLVVRDQEAVRAVRAAHSAFGLTRVVHLMLVGCGKVGKALLTQLSEAPRQLDGIQIELRLIGVVNSSHLLIDDSGIDPAAAQTRLASAAPRPPDREIVGQLQSLRYTDLIVVDVSASPLADLHRLALDAGFHVVTANKVPLSGDLATYEALVSARNRSGVRYGYETTVGAGLPVMHTLKELIHTGDRLSSVTGCFSGTLGFLCSRLEEGVGLRDAVAEAQELGYTEPDPRDDLSGRDVARKALILARALGKDLEPDQLDLRPMVPGMEQGLAPALAAYEGELFGRLDAARARGNTLRYVAEIDDEGVCVHLKEVPAEGPIGSLRGPDNILVFRTGRYEQYPLVIQGPGAGAEVTAAGVLGDVLRTVRETLLP